MAEIKAPDIRRTRQTIFDWDKIKQEFLTGNWRSLKEFKRSKGIKDTTVLKFRGWVKEREIHQKQLVEDSAKKTLQKEIEAVSDIRLRQVRLSRFIQMKGAEKLRNAKTEEISIDDARKLVVTGMQEERKALGIDESGSGNSFTQVNINGRTNFDKLIEGLDYEGLLQFIAKIKRERTRRAIQQTNVDSTGKVQDGEIV